MISPEDKAFQKLALDEKEYAEWEWMMKINERLNRPKQEVQDDKERESNTDTP